MRTYLFLTDSNDSQDTINRYKKHFEVDEVFYLNSNLPLLTFTEEDIVIFGISNTLSPKVLDKIDFLLPSLYRSKKVLIGNHCFYDLSTDGKFPDTFRHFDLVGISNSDISLREINYFPYMPVFDTNFDLVSSFTAKNKYTEIYEEEDESIVVPYIANSEYVITSELKIYLLATYLKRKVIIIPKDTSTMMLKWTPLYAKTKEEALKMIENGEGNIYRDAYSYDIFHFNLFKSKFENLKRNEMIVKYSIPSTNLGDNLVWMESILEHSNKKYIKKAHVSLSKWSPFVSQIDFSAFSNKISFNKQDDETFDEKKMLSVGCCKNWRKKSMVGISDNILGVISNYKNRFSLSHLVENQPRPIKERYITYASEGSYKWKGWNYSENGRTGWQILEEMVWKELGIKMINCSVEVSDIPKDIITGACRYIHYSDLFIGCGSGLSWVAYYLSKKQILISGTSMPNTEMNEKDENISFIRPPSDYKGCKFCYNLIDLFPRNHDCATKNNYSCTQSIKPQVIFEEIKKKMEQLQS